MLPVVAAVAAVLGAVAIARPMFGWLAAVGGRPLLVNVLGSSHRRSQELIFEAVAQLVVTGPQTPG